MKQLILLGENRVGKTALILKLLYGNYRASFPELTHNFGPPTDQFVVCGKRITLRFEEINPFRPIAPVVIRNAKAVIFMFDITSEKSFSKCILLKQSIEDHVRDDPIFILVGNKCDEIIERRINFEECLEYAERLNMIYVEISAKNGYNTKVLIDLIAVSIFNNQT